MICLKTIHFTILYIHNKIPNNKGNKRRTNLRWLYNIGNDEEISENEKKNSCILNYAEMEDSAQIYM